MRHLFQLVNRMFINPKLFTLLTLIAATLLLAAQCGAAQSEHNETLELSTLTLADGEKLKVVATTNIVADLVRNVGRDSIELVTMLPIGSDPHTFTPTPQDVISVAEAHVVFINGLNLEEFLEKLIENAGGEAAIVATSINVVTREFAALTDEKHSPEPDNHEEHEDEDYKDHANEKDLPENEHPHTHPGADPHIWMTPVNAIVMVHNIERALSQLDPDNAPTYKSNAEAYQAELEALDTWVKEQVELIPAPKRQLVTDHVAFGYYADRYGLHIIGAVIPATSTSAEPSAQELAELQQAIAQFETPAIFVGTTVNPVLTARLAEDTGLKLISLYTGSLGKVGSGVESYPDLIRYNTTAIVTALK